MSAFGVLREEERRRMNKFAPPTGDENVAPGTLPAEQTGAAQPVPGPNAAWSQGVVYLGASLGGPHRLLWRNPAPRW